MNLFLQFLANGFVTGCGYIPVACGLTLIYSVTGVFNFSHGVFYVIAGSVAYLLVESLQMSLGPSLVFATVVTALLSYTVWVHVFAPLQRQNASPMILMLASIALLILIQNAWLLITGNSRLSLQYESLDESLTSVRPLVLSGAQVLAVPTAILSVIMVEAFLRLTSIGRAMRATSSNRSLATDQGMNVGLLCGLAFALGGALAGASGYLDLLDPGVGIDPIRNFRVVLVSTVASLVGGAHHMAATAVACVFIGVTRTMSIWLTAEDWGDTVMAGILITFICVRSVGISGRRLWKEVA